MHVIFEHPSGGYTTHSPAPPGLQTPPDTIRREFATRELMDAAISAYPVASKPKWVAALQQIHEGLSSLDSTNPFIQIRFWADTSLTWKLDARVKDFISAFQQPLDDEGKRGAVQSGLGRVWAALTADQQTALNKAAIATWNEAHNLELSLPWS